METIKSCSIKYCNGLGHLDNGRRYFSNGLCTKHYTRQLRGLPLEYSSRKDRRIAIVDGDIAKIPLGVDAKDGYAIIDKKFAWIDKYNWCLFSNGYPARKGQYMHHIIIGYPNKNMQIDHINRNRKDNRLCNLRVVTSSQNNANMSSTNRNGYRGVYKSSTRYYAKISKDYKSYYLGMYNTAYEAALAYNKKSIELYGKYAVTNKIRGV